MTKKKPMSNPKAEVVRKTFDDDHGRHALIHEVGKNQPLHGRIDVHHLLQQQGVKGLPFHLTRVRDGYQPKHAEAE